MDLGGMMRPREGGGKWCIGYGVEGYQGYEVSTCLVIFRV